MKGLRWHAWGDCGLWRGVRNNGVGRLLRKHQCCCSSKRARSAALASAPQRGVASIDGPLVMRTRLRTCSRQQRTRIDQASLLSQFARMGHRCNSATMQGLRLCKSPFAQICAPYCATRISRKLEYPRPCRKRNVSHSGELLL